MEGKEMDEVLSYIKLVEVGDDLNEVVLVGENLMKYLEKKRGMLMTSVDLLEWMHR
jgi:hypothetical protein